MYQNLVSVMRFFWAVSSKPYAHARAYMQKSCKSRLGFIAGHELREDDGIIIYSPSLNTFENEKVVINNGAIINDRDVSEMVPAP